MIVTLMMNRRTFLVNETDCWPAGKDAALSGGMEFRPPR
jgi:hypothetical protein